MGGNAFAPAGIAQLFRGAGLDIEACTFRVAGLSQIRLHPAQMRGQFRFLADDADIGVGQAHAAADGHLPHCGQEFQTVRVFVTGIAVREMAADVAKRQRAQKGIHKGVADYVGVRVAQKAQGVVDGHPAQNQFAAGNAQ